MCQLYIGVYIAEEHERKKINSILARAYDTRVQRI